MDIAPFVVPDGAAAGQYILHYYWRGYRDCIDIDVLPDAQPVPDTNRGKYGEHDDSLQKYVRVDHCQFEAGSYNTFVGDVDPECDVADRRGTCFVVPPIGLTNQRGQTREEALAACQTRCDRNKNLCKSVVVVPATMPGGVTLDVTAPTNAPWGVGNCKQECLEDEHEGSSVCYGLAGISNKNVRSIRLK